MLTVYTVYSWFCCHQVPKNPFIKPSEESMTGQTVLPIKMTPLHKTLNGPHKDRGITTHTLSCCLHCAVSGRQCVF